MLRLDKKRPASLRVRSLQATPGKKCNRISRRFRAQLIAAS